MWRMHDFRTGVAQNCFRNTVYYTSIFNFISVRGGLFCNFSHRKLYKKPDITMISGPKMWNIYWWIFSDSFLRANFSHYVTTGLKNIKCPKPVRDLWKTKTVNTHAEWPSNVQNYSIPQPTGMSMKRTGLIFSLFE